ncbi:MAG: pantothenate kinase [Candidatus Cloacimonetes bacterium 4572_55]|nr:MAG: pantothenate kinase [Candidatus Cloacimonetes bacterium 4572_55]
MESSEKKQLLIMAIDVGNSNITVGIFKGDELIDQWRLRTRLYTADELGLLFYQLTRVNHIEIPDRIIICSVSPRVTLMLKMGLSRYLTGNIEIVDYRSDMGISISYETPDTLGIDRLVNAFAAVELYRADCLIVDIGTATTLDTVTNQREYIGGVILPGIEMAAESLTAKTAQLFTTELVPPPTVIGKSTRACIQSGLIFGAIDQIDGLIVRICKEWGRKPKVIATGGHARLIAKYSTTITKIEPMLTLIGLQRLTRRLF